MNFAQISKNRYILQQLLTKNGIENFRQLSLKADVPELQIFRLQYGLIGKMSLETLVKIASALNISLEQLISSFDDNSYLDKVISPSDSETLKQELTQEFQLASLDILESWLLQWPSAVNAVKNNPDLPALRLLPLVKPIFQLLESWGIEMIANVGDKIPYNPQFHDLMEGSAQPGDLVEVTYPGYRQGDKLLYRGKCRSVS
jgi:DNA-binding Xre family transcriptional regulator